MDKTIEELRKLAVDLDRQCEAPGFDGTVVAQAARSLSECRDAMQSFIEGNPQLAPSEVVTKYQEWFRELLA